MAEYTYEDKSYEYTPVAYGNDKEDKPAVFTLRFMIPGDRKKNLDISFDANGETRVTPNYENAVKNGVERIENLVYNGEAIKTHAQFRKCKGLYNMYQEVALEIIASNAQDVDSKNLQ